MLLKASGDATFALTLNGAPSQLFGCGPAGPLTGATTFPLAGHVGPNGLLGPYSAEQADIVRGLLDDLHAVSDLSLIHISEPTRPY